MSQSPAPPPTVIEGRASRLAFQIGQFVEQMVLDRAIDLAAREGEVEIVVTTEHLRRALDDFILEDARDQIGAALDAAENPPKTRSAA